MAMTSQSSLPSQPVLLYDGTCGFCARSVQFILSAERTQRTLSFATLGGQVGDVIRKEFPETAGEDSVVLYLPPTPGRPARALLRSAAALEVARYLGGKWRTLAVIAMLVPRPLRDVVYDLIARHRHRIAGAQVCLLPTEEERGRFLDADEPGHRS
jgi:predicted DCC family thiol-disulfide oxidoreductase YuxK